MNKQEAKRLLVQALEPYRSQSFEDLQRLLDAQDIELAYGTSGVKYYLEIFAMWDDKPGGNLRVWGNIDDGGWLSMFPLCSSFIMSPSGEFIGE